MRVTAQLIHAPRDQHLWAERYDRNLEDVFALQDEICEQIVAAIDATPRTGAASDEITADASAPAENSMAGESTLDRAKSSGDSGQLVGDAERTGARGARGCTDLDAAAAQPRNGGHARRRCRGCRNW